jgi:hypothetical protein
MQDEKTNQKTMDESQRIRQPNLAMPEANTSFEKFDIEISKLSDVAKDYLKEEQRQRRQEIENFLTRIETDQRNALFGMGVFCSWLILSAIDMQLKKIIIFIPAIITAFFYYRWWIMHQAILATAEYTRKLEFQIGITKDDVNLGWETWLVKKLKAQDFASLGGANKLFWILLLGVNLISIVLFWLKLIPEPPR